MKRKIFFAFTAMIIAVAALNTINEKYQNDIDLNQIGGACIYHGLTNESDGSTFIGGGIATLGGSAVVQGAGAAAGAWGAGLIFSPLGWIGLGVAAIV